MFSQTNDLQKAIDLANNGGGASADAPANTESSGTESAEGANNFSAIQDQLGVPPMPPTDGAGVPPMPAPFGDGAMPNVEAATPAAASADVPAVTPDAASSPAPNSEATKANPSPESPESPENPAASETPEVHTSNENASDTANAMPPATQTIPVSIETPADSASSEPSAEQILSEDGDIAKIRENVLKDLIPLMDKVQSDPESKFEIYKDAMETLHDKALVSGAYKQASQITDENKKAESLIELMKAIDTLK